MSVSKKSSGRNWIDAIKHYGEYPPEGSYYELASLRKGDSMMHVYLRDDEFCGLYKGLKVPKVEEGVEGYVCLRLTDGSDVKIPGKVTAVCGRQHRFVLSHLVKSFEVFGSLDKQLAEARKDIGKKRFIEDYLTSATKVRTGD